MMNFSIYAEAIILLDAVIHAEDDQSDCFSPTFNIKEEEEKKNWSCLEIRNDLKRVSKFTLLSLYLNETAVLFYLTTSNDLKWMSKDMTNKSFDV